MTPSFGHTSLYGRVDRVDKGKGEISARESGMKRAAGAYLLFRLAPRHGEACAAKILHQFLQAFLGLGDDDLVPLDRYSPAFDARLVLP